MSNPKFTTLEELKKKEEEQTLKQLNKEPIDANVFEALSKSSSPNTGASTSSTNPLDNVHKNEEQITNIVKKKTIKMWDIIRILIPISVAILLVIMYVKFIEEDNWLKGKTTGLLKFNRRIGSKSSSIMRTLLIPLIIFVAILVLTFILFFLFYFRCDNVIRGLIGIAFGFIFVFIALRVYRDILIHFNIPLDSITVYLLLWNYSVLAMISIFWRAPLILNQVFLINVTTLGTINLLVLLDQWTTWALLIILVFWDLIAVLCPFGPLNLLMSNLKKRKQEDPNYQPPRGLLYSTTLIWIFVILDSVPKTKKDDNKTMSLEEINSNKVIEKYDGPRLGLGDFVFYSLLMGKAARYGDFNLIMGCYLGILVGFLLTLALLAIYQKPLPALPISLTLAIIIFVISYVCVTPFLNELSSHLIYF